MTVAGQVIPWAGRRPAQVPARTLGDLIMAQAMRMPDAVAVRQWEQVITYRELVTGAAQLAVRLRQAGVGPEAPVGVYAERTAWLPAMVLGVLLAGGAFVPLDPDQPVGRLTAIMEESGAELAVAGTAGEERLSGTGRLLVSGLPASGGAVAGAVAPAPALCGPDNAAYVMFTSGSTGRPKGIVITHRAVLALVTTVGREFRIGGHTRGIGFAALGFDASVLDILVPLTHGGSVQLVPERDRVDPDRLQRFLEEHGVTWGFLPPAVLPVLDPDRLADLADILTGGEAPGPEQVRRWSVPGKRRFHNVYGPTEATVCVTATGLAGAWERPVPIGRPLPGCRVHVLDERMRPCPPGVPGEIYVGGVQLARCYVGQRGHTAERFLPDPLSGEPGERLYRTGDLAVCGPDGVLEYRGRVDRQVKIRGQRVEIGEVETVLRGHPRVQHAVVDAAPGHAGLTELVAYLTPADAPDLGELQAYCRPRLPAYMVPTRAVRCASFRFKPSGKVDLAALRDTAIVASGRALPDTPAARTVAKAWAQAFGSAEPGPGDDFFACGGHSLLAMRLVAALRALSNRSVGVEDLYRARTASALAAAVAAAPPAADQVPPASPSRPARPVLSAAQRRMWFVEQLEPGTPVHNVPFAVRLTGQLDVQALQAALCAVAERHEVLRWRIRPGPGGEAEVTVRPPAAVGLAVTGLAGLAARDRDAELRRLLDAEARTPLELARGPLCRARLFRLGASDHVLSVVVHHIVFDGWSQDVFCRDLAGAYADAARGGRGAQAPPAARATFTDYVAWLAEQTAERGKLNLDWWSGHLAGARAVLDLPRDRPRPVTQTFRGGIAEIQIGQETRAGLERLSARLGVTRYAVLLAAFGILLRRLTGQHDLIVGAPFADRRRAAFEPLVGFFLQILPLRLHIRDERDFAGHVRHCQDELVAAFAHMDAPYESIIELAGAPRDLSRSPLIQVLFNAHPFAEPRLDLPGITARAVPPGLQGSLFDFTLEVIESSGRIKVQGVYNPDLYDAERIGALLASYATLLAELAGHPDQPVRRAPLRPPGSGLPDWSAPLPRWDGPGLVERVSRSVAAYPRAPAVTGPGQTLSYRDLAEVYAQVVTALRAAGVTRGDPVAVLGARHPRLPAILLGVLGTGARWVILDPAYPPGYLARQAAAVRPRAVIDLARHPDLPAITGNAPVIGPDLPAAVATTAGLAADVAPPARSYLALTSGTTGRARVVLTGERPLDHFLDWYQATFGLNRHDRFAMLSGLAHDPLLRDLFMPLVLGARLCVPAEEQLRDPRNLIGWLRSEQVTVIHLTPPLARLMISQQDGSPAGYGGDAAILPRLRLIGLAGDQATSTDVAGLRRLAPQARLVNLYGTTETPQAQAFHEIADVRGPAPEPAVLGPAAVPVGRGIDGAQLVILGCDHRPAAVGEIGEVLIRSRYLADGYTDPRLSGEYFGRTPHDADGHRFFRTGDLGRYLADGSVMLAGRIDRQAKIRGFRVEPGEIEAILTGHPLIRQACVTITSDGGDQRLSAYAVPGGPGLSAEDVRAHLRAHLPAHAVPGAVMLLDALPLTPNGKVDAAALPAALPPAPPRPGQQPSSRTERVVAGAWREVLGLPRVELDENFFDVGGDSLAIVAVRARLERVLGVPVQVVDLFRYPTIGSLASYLDGGRKEAVFARAELRAAQRRRRASRRSTRRPSRGEQS